MTVATRILIYVALLCAGVAVYYGIDYLPESWREWLKGKKTQLVGWAAIVLPEVVSIATEVQALGLLDYAPNPVAKVAMQVIGVLALVMRLRTKREQGA
jgi:hypothetical protein